MNENHVELMKQCGQSIIDNAESIVGTEKYLNSITVYIRLNNTDLPTIEVDREFAPEGFIDYLRDNC